VRDYRPETKKTAPSHITKKMEDKSNKLPFHADPDTVEEELGVVE